MTVELTIFPKAEDQHGDGGAQAEKAHPAEGCTTVKRHPPSNTAAVRTYVFAADEI